MNLCQSVRFYTFHTFRILSLTGMIEWPSCLLERQSISYFILQMIDKQNVSKTYQTTLIVQYLTRLIELVSLRTACMAVY